MQPELRAPIATHVQGNPWLAKMTADIIIIARHRKWSKIYHDPSITPDFSSVILEEGVALFDVKYPLGSLNCCISIFILLLYNDSVFLFIKCF